MKVIKSLLVALALGAFCQQAGATPINGSLGFFATANSSGSVSSGTSTITFGNPVETSIAMGDYSGVPALTMTNFASISWTGSGTSAVLTSSNTPEWTFTVAGITYSFDLLSLSSASLDANAVSLHGMGTAHITGKDDTISSFAVEGTGGNFTFTIVQASNSSAGVVPDSGSAVALLGLGLLGLEVVRRKLASA